MKRNSGILTVILAAVVGIAVVWTGNHFGFWWVTVLVGLAIGFLLSGVWTTLVTATLAGVGGWGLDLFWQSLHTNIGEAASVVSGIMGFGVSHGFIVVLLTLVLAWLLSLVGTWVGVALHRVVLGPRRYIHNLQDTDARAVPTEAASPQTNVLTPTEAAPIQTSEG